MLLLFVAHMNPDEEIKDRKLDGTYLLLLHILLPALVDRFRSIHHFIISLSGVCP